MGCRTCVSGRKKTQPLSLRLCFELHTLKGTIGFKVGERPGGKKNERHLLRTRGTGNTHKNPGQLENTSLVVISFILFLLDSPEYPHHSEVFLPLTPKATVSPQTTPPSPPPTLRLPGKDRFCF